MSTWVVRAPAVTWCYYKVMEAPMHAMHLLQPLSQVLASSLQLGTRVYIWPMLHRTSSHKVPRDASRLCYSPVPFLHSLALKAMLEAGQCRCARHNKGSQQPSASGRGPPGMPCRLPGACWKHPKMAVTQCTSWSTKWCSCRLT